MNDFARKGLAFCMILVLAATVAEAAREASLSKESYARYRQERLFLGASTFPVIAQLTHRQALQALREGNADRAETLLMQTLDLDPNFSDAYFTLAKIKATQFSSDTFYYLSKAITTLWTSFHYQRLLAVNIVLFALLAAAMLASIFCVAFLIKYLPFAAHRLREFFSKRFHAAAPGLLAYLILLIPFALLPGFVTALALTILISWAFMLKREKLLTIFTVLPFIALGFFSDFLKPFAPLADPSSLTSRISTANSSHADPRLIAALERTPAGNLETDKDLALGLLHLRSEQFLPAATRFLKAISNDPENVKAYVNLGNVYYLQGNFDKALEGYRKATALDSLDAVCQYNLAQAYIKTLLLAESSRALRRASASGIEKVKQSFASSALRNLPVYPKAFSTADLWRISRIEGETYVGGDLRNVLLPLTRFTPRASAWILVGALFLAILVFRLIDRRRLTFQCSNCGELTCEDCCIDDRGGFYCQRCAESIRGVFSEKVVEALLRQRRQAVIVKRRKSVRLLTSVLPGIRDMYYQRLVRGICLAALFSLSLILLWSKGLIIKDWTSIDTHTSLWKTILSGAGIACAYMLAVFSKPSFDSRSFRSSGARARTKEPGAEESATGAVA